MNDFNQSESQLHFEFAEYETMKPSFEQFISQKTTISDGAFDPHQLMMKKKLTDAGQPDTTPKQSWPDPDIKALESFCMKYRIVGFNCGRMSPVAALAMLKQKMGVIEPTENRVTYSDAMKQKTLLKG